MALTFESLELFPYPFDRSSVLVWEVNGTVSPTTYVVERSERPTGGFRTVGVVVDTQEFHDEEFVLRDLTTQLWYRVIAQQYGKRYDSPVISWDTNPAKPHYSAGAAILRQEYMMLRPYPEVTTFLKIKSGTPCTVCNDDRLPAEEQVGNSLCNTCLGTGFEGGYIVGAKTPALIPEVKQQKSQEPQGNVHPHRATARLVPYPRLHQGDLIRVPYSRDLFVVDQVQVYRYAGKIPVAMEVQMTLIPPSDIRQRL